MIFTPRYGNCRAAAPVAPAVYTGLALGFFRRPRTQQTFINKRRRAGTDLCAPHVPCPVKMFVKESRCLDFSQTRNCVINGIYWCFGGSPGALARSSLYDRPRACHTVCGQAESCGGMNYLLLSRRDRKTANSNSNVSPISSYSKFPSPRRNRAEAQKRNLQKPSCTKEQLDKSSRRTSPKANMEMPLPSMQFDS